MKVWVARVESSNGPDFDEVIGVYSTPELAKDAFVEYAEDPDDEEPDKVTWTFYPPRLHYGDNEDRGDAYYIEGFEVIDAS